MLTIDDRRSASVRGCLGPLGDCLDNLDHRGRAVDSRPDVLVPHTTVVQCSRQLWRRQEDIYDAKKAQTKAKEFAPVSRLFVQVPAPRGGCGVKTGPAWFVAGAAGTGREEGRQHLFLAAVSTVAVSFFLFFVCEKMTGSERST
jgi:hypothetical protein